MSEMQHHGMAELREAGSLIEAREFRRAVEILKARVDADETGECHALLGLACFHREDYRAAEMHYAAALELGDGNEEWRRMRDLARANARAAVQVPVPEIAHFERAPLLAPPRVKDGSLPGPPAPVRIGRLRKILEAVGNLSGRVAGPLSHGLVGLHGLVFGYRGRLWTNWYRRGHSRAILTLAYMRDRLNRNNLRDTYPSGALVAFQESAPIAPEGARHFRTADGSWNDLTDPRQGAASTRFMRNVGNEAIRDELRRDLMTPSPREVSRRLLTREKGAKTVPFLNLLAASWIQFQNHDWVSHGENSQDFFRIPLAEDDPIRLRYRQKDMRVGKTQPDPTRMKGRESTEITFINEVTHWWDGSQLYGSDQDTQDRLRSHQDGKLALSSRGLLPIGQNGVEDTGFTRNWWVGLSMFHTLFAREHNAICDHLKAAYPHWDDDRLFNVARLVNAAVMAKIHTVEWTPAILPNRAANRALHANWFGLLTHWLHPPKQRRTRSSVNVRHPELGGVVGNPIHKHGSPYGLTEEFVEVYRLHSLLPESLTLKRHDSGDLIKEIPVPETRQAGSAQLTAWVPMADLFYSFGNQHPGSLELNNFPRFLQELSIPGYPVLDLGAVDILRARERGVPRYNEFRRQLGLRPIRSFRDLTGEKAELEALEEVYPGGVEDLDLLIGTLAESSAVRPPGFGFGETLFQIFILNATRRLQADRFYTDCYNQEIYTKEGLDWVDAADLKTVLLRHHPELASTGLANVKNAFEPWDTSYELEEKLHPLRAFDEDLQPDPWIGDRYRSRHDVLDYRRDRRSKIFRSKLLEHFFMRGVFLRRPRHRRFRTRTEVGRRDLQTLADMRCGAGALWLVLKSGESDTLALFDRAAIGEVLARSPHPFGPSDAKRRGMQLFQPGALTITSDPDAFRVRREMTEEVLGFGERVHESAQDFLEIVRQEVVRADRDALPDALVWNDVDALCKRVALRITLGRWDPQLLRRLERLMDAANVAAMGSAPIRGLVNLGLAWRDSRAKSRGRLGAALALPRVFVDRLFVRRREFDAFYAALGQYLIKPDDASLVGRLAALPDREGATKVRLIPHWIFALRGTLAVHTIYTLALLASDRRTQDAVRASLQELGSDGIDRALTDPGREPDRCLELLERCILEAGRLWPAVPLLVRGVQEDVVLQVGETPVRLEKGQQVLIHNVANNRDAEQVGPAPHAFRPERWKPRGAGGDELAPIIREQPHAATLFGGGPQTCPGRDMALLLAKAILGRLLLTHRYRPKGDGLDPTDLPVSYDQFEIALERQRVS